MEIEDVENEFVHFPEIRKELEKMGVVGNMILKFAKDPDAPKGVKFSGRGWRMFKRSEVNAYLAKKREKLGLMPLSEIMK